MSQIAVRTFHDIRAALLARRELALLDVREEDPFAQAHPLFAVNLPLSRLELEIHARVPRRDTPITVYDDGEGLAPVAAQRLLGLGYSDVALLDGGLSGWRNAGGELFRDVNVPSRPSANWWRPSATRHRWPRRKYRLCSTPGPTR